MGVRISWLIMARNSLLARVADSAVSFASRNSSSTFLRPVMSLRTINLPVNRPRWLCNGEIRRSK